MLVLQLKLQSFLLHFSVQFALVQTFSQRASQVCGTCFLSSWWASLQRWTGRWVWPGGAYRSQDISSPQPALSYRGGRISLIWQRTAFIFNSADSYIFINTLEYRNQVHIYINVSQTNVDYLTFDFLNHFTFYFNHFFIYVFVRETHKTKNHKDYAVEEGNSEQKQVNAYGVQAEMWKNVKNPSLFAWLQTDRKQWHFFSLAEYTVSCLARAL